MKNTLVLMLSLILAVALMGFVSADGKTVVVGTIYDKSDLSLVSGANVNVTCNGSVMSAVSGADGTYHVSFDLNVCSVGSTLSTHASKDAMSGDSLPVTVYDGQAQLGLDCAIGLADADVFLIPEFGIVMGVMTVVGALVAFFIVRRK